MINLLVAVGSFKYLYHGEENGGQVLCTHVKENTLILKDFSFALHRLSQLVRVELTLETHIILPSLKVSKG